MSINIFQLPQSAGSKFVQNSFAPFQNYQTLLQYFQNTYNMTFYTDRLQLFVGANVNLENTYDQPNVALPFEIGVLPSFETFNFSTDPSHLAASIVGYRTGQSATFIGAYVTVNHDHVNNVVTLGDFNIVEINATGGVQETSVDINQLETMSTESLANALGLPPINLSQWNTDAGPNPPDTANLANIAMVGMIDNYSAPLYPPSALHSILNIGTLSERFALVVRQRYQNALGEVTLCSSSSCTCNVCSSSSSSSVTINL